MAQIEILKELAKKSLMSPDTPENLPVEEPECNLCGDTMTEEQLKVHHCS